ncbi:MAG: DUF4432 family protein [Candidatus Atribacteria bacterium]|nr:DUF4432 family protein [Candidatus Atribacteria bacterium]
MVLNGEMVIGKEMFPVKERELVRWGVLKASLFIYESGIHAVKLENQLGYLVVLPYKGQQIWEAVFYGRDIKMKSKFDEPKNVDGIAHTYGGFLYHCGALRTGNPGKDDTHPLHGELPYADFDQARLLFGRDEKGQYIGLTSQFQYNDAFASHYYRAYPVVKIYDNSALMDVSIKIDNLSSYPMEHMYMTHINFRPINHGHVVQPVDWKPEFIQLRENTPAHSKDIPLSQDYVKFINTIKTNPEYLQTIRPEDPYLPEVVLYLKSPKTDSEGWTHFLQVHPDGSGDYVSYRPDELDHATRWIIRNRDREAFGLLLPGTCDPEGYTHEKAAGNVRLIPEQGSVTHHVVTGALDPGQTADMQKKIEALR